MTVISKNHAMVYQGICPRLLQERAETQQILKGGACGKQERLGLQKINPRHSMGLPYMPPH